MMIEGTILRDINGQSVSIPFLINGDTGTCSQWGHNTAILGENVDLLEKLSNAVWEATNDALGEVPCVDCGLGQTTPHSQHVVTPPAVPGDGYCQDEQERDR